MEGKTNFLLEYAACPAETGGGGIGKKKGKKPTINPVIRNVKLPFWLRTF